MMWYRGTPPSLEQTKGMPIPMMDYSFGDGGDEFFPRFLISSFNFSFSAWQFCTKIRRDSLLSEVGDDDLVMRIEWYSIILRRRQFSSWSISTSLLRARYWSQNSSVVRRTSSNIGKESRLRAGGKGPCRLWEKERRVSTDPTKICLLPPACCSCLDGTLFTSSSESPLPLLLEAMVLLDQRQILAETARNKTRRENDIRTSRGPGDYIE